MVVSCPSEACGTLPYLLLYANLPVCERTTKNPGLASAPALSCLPSGSIDSSAAAMFNSDRHAIRNAHNHHRARPPSLLFA